MRMWQHCIKLNLSLWTWIEYMRNKLFQWNKLVTIELDGIPLLVLSHLIRTFVSTTNSPACPFTQYMCDCCARHGVHRHNIPLNILWKWFEIFADFLAILAPLWMLVIFFRITFVTVSYLASSIRIPTFLSFVVPFFLIKKKVKFNLLPDSRRALVALSNLSTLVSMANGHCSHSNLSPDTKVYGKKLKRKHNEWNDCNSLVFVENEIESRCFVIHSTPQENILFIIYYSPLLHWFSTNSPAPISRQFEGFQLFSVEWFLYHLTMSVRKTLEYLLICCVRRDRHGN